MQLPPKRFELTDSTKFDPIRYHPWFGKLQDRREKLPFLKEAYRLWKWCDMTQGQAADTCSVDARELRDYGAFVENQGQEPNRTFQAILDDSYGLYGQAGGRLSFRNCIDRTAPLYGVNPRHVCERWEVDPTFYPTGYQKP